MHDRIGVDVLQSIIEKAQFVLAQYRVGLNESVHGRTQVFLEPWHANLCGFASAAYGGPSFQNQDAESGLAQISGRNQAIVAGPGDDKIEGGFITGNFLQCCRMQ